MSLIPCDAIIKSKIMWFLKLKMDKENPEMLEEVLRLCGPFPLFRVKAYWKHMLECEFNDVTDDSQESKTEYEDTNDVDVALFLFKQTVSYHTAKRTKGKLKVALQYTEDGKTYGDVYVDQKDL